MSLYLGLIAFQILKIWSVYLFYLFKILKNTYKCRTPSSREGCRGKNEITRFKTIDR